MYIKNTVFSKKKNIFEPNYAYLNYKIISHNVYIIFSRRKSEKSIFYTCFIIMQSIVVRDN